MDYMKSLKVRNNIPPVFCINSIFFLLRAYRFEKKKKKEKEKEKSKIDEND